MTILGLSSLSRSYPSPILARNPGRIASITTSDSRTRSSNTAIASGDEETGVDRDRALEPVEELAEGLPLPVDALLERRERHALDPRHHPSQVVGVAVVQGREAEAAVAAD